MYIEYFALAIPILTAVVAFFFFKRALVWWEMLLPIGVCLIMIAIWSSIARSGLSNDKELWNDNVVKIEYYEKWNEWIDRTCSRQVACGTESYSCGTSKSPRTCYRTKYCTEYYDCSYEQKHPEIWQAVLSKGRSVGITKKEYHHFKNLWNNEEEKDMHRDYYTYDGDMYFSNYDKHLDHSLTRTWVNTYENKTQAAYSTFEFEKVDTAYAKNLGLHPYPEFKRQWNHDYLIGYDDKTFEKELRYQNGIHGPSIQLVTWILVFKNKGIDQAMHQRSFWKGGNKNEAVLCISLDDDGNIEWSKVFTWSEKMDFIYDYETLFEKGSPFASKLNSQTLLEMNRIATSSWKRKEFEDFEYITIPLHAKTVMWIYIITGIISFGLTGWGIFNEFKYDENGRLI